MRKFIFYLLLLFSTTMYSQDNLAEKDSIYDGKDVDVKAEFEGGIQKFSRYTMKHFYAPEKSGLNGKIIVEFVVEKTGEITNIQIIQDVGYGSAESAFKLFDECPNWIPGKKNNEIVRTRNRFPINIKTE